MSRTLLNEDGSMSLILVLTDHLKNLELNCTI